jgi:hypothetical protein
VHTKKNLAALAETFKKTFFSFIFACRNVVIFVPRCLLGLHFTVDILKLKAHSWQKWLCALP